MKRKQLKTLALILSLILAVLIIVSGCQSKPIEQTKQSSTLKKVINEGVLHVGYIIYPPTVQRDPNTGTLSGHYVETVEEIAKQLGVKVEYHETEWGTFMVGLATGKFDLSIGATYRTIPRAKEVAFTRPLMYVGNSVIVAKEDTRFESIQDFNNKDITIAVTQGEQGHEYAKIYLPNAKLKVLSTSDQSLSFSEISAGRADAALGDSWACKQYAAVHPEVKDLLADNPYNLSPVGWSVRYDDIGWLQFINTALDALESTGKLREFEQKVNAHWLHPKISWDIW